LRAHGANTFIQGICSQSPRGRRERIGAFARRDSFVDDGASGKKFDRRLKIGR